LEMNPNIFVVHEIKLKDNTYVNYYNDWQ